MDASSPRGTHRTEYVVTELKVNEPLPAGGTALPLPAGVKVKDELRQTEYQGNPDWTPAGPETKWQPLRVAAPGDPGPDTGPTQIEPTDRSYWLLYGSAAVLAAGLVGLAVRKRLARPAGLAA
jgi:hypothetical protein